LATALPVVSDGGKTYTATLRKGLEFSNGKPVVASDFACSIVREVKIPWGGSGQFVDGTIVGAQAVANGKAATISGITTDDATGKIVIHLIAPYGAFDNVLAFPSSGVIPCGTPNKNEPTSPPPGVGPYMITNIVPNASFDVVMNPLYAKFPIPGVPAGHVNVDVKINPNVTAGALSVLNNQTDFFDWADTIPGSLLPQIKSRAGSRYQVKVMNSTYYFFLNSTIPPFNNQMAREAVVTGLDRNALNKLGAGTLIPACYFLPPGMIGHPTAPCPYGSPGTPNLAKAKALVKASGQEGAKVTVWSETRTPRQQWATYYMSFLNSIGFKATIKVIADATYFTTIGNLSLNPQTGFADWNQDFPNPVDFYLLLPKAAILKTNNENFGQVNDPYLNTQIAKLGAVPTSQLPSIASQWQTVDEYTAKKAYVAVFGYQTFPEFASSRVDFSKLVFSPLYGWDYSSFQLK
jgi:peptide/nickel transport system substrate-binding protein